MKEKILLIGGGGHAKVVIDAIKCSGKYEICGIADAKLKAGNSVLGVKVIGGDDMLDRIFKDGVRNAFVAIGSIGDERSVGVRISIAANLKKIGFNLPAIVHPRAIVAEDVSLGEGTFVAAGAVINPGTKIGRNAIINTNSSVDHDCIIGNFVHIAPGATLSGGVKVGDEAHVGTGANITQGVSIEQETLVRAGTLVSRDI